MVGCKKFGKPTLLVLIESGWRDNSRGIGWKRCRMRFVDGLRLDGDVEGQDRPITLGHFRLLLYAGHFTAHKFLCEFAPEAYPLARFIVVTIFAGVA